VTLTAPDGNPSSSRGLASWLAKAAPAGARGDVTVALVSDARMRTLNRSYRNKDYATDVLSFSAYAPSELRRDKPASAPSELRRDKPASAAPERRRGTAPTPAPTESTYLGDIVIATGVAQRQADEVGHSVGAELKILALHGLLHLLGYDHETDSGEMARLEARLRRRAGLAEGLISRHAR
jgi:probable rRNA maturation factor